MSISWLSTAVLADTPKPKNSPPKPPCTSCAADSDPAIDYAQLSTNAYLQSVTTEWLQSLSTEAYLKSETTEWFQSLSTETYLQSETTEWLQSLSTEFYFQSLSTESYLQSISTENILAHS